MTSDKERREIARRLRAAAKTKSDSADYLWKRLEIAVNGWRFGDGIDESYVFYNDVLSRLADLIDPTCHVSDEEVTHQPTLDAMAVHVYTCDRCNSPFYMGDVCMHPKPLYCPYCGARVVSER